MSVLNAVVRILDSYPLQLLVCAHMFAFSFPRRPQFWLKLVIHALPMLIIYDISTQISPSGVTDIFLLNRGVLLLPILYTCLGLAFCYQCSALEALFCTASAHPAQNIVFNLYWIAKMHIGFQERTLQALPVSLSLMLVVYLAVYFVFARRLHELERARYMRKRIVLNAVIVTLFVIFFNQRATGARWEENVYMAYVFADVLALIMQFGLLQESETESRYAIVEQLLYAEQKKQQMTAENVELINRKCHDLKHQIAALKRMETGSERDEYIRKIENAVMFYESAVKTGNETLDLILMDKLLYCQEHRIKLTCVSDGEKLKYMDTMDIYALFGNAIDNAIESVSHEPEESKRIISMRVGSQGQFLSIHIENYVGHEVKLSGGLPLTTKSDKQYHGFGVLSIKRITEKYDGTISIRSDGNLFRLDILIPIQTASA